MPFRKNDIVPNVEITDIGEGGAGIGHAEGMALFVRHALPGDVLTARITKAGKTYAYARIESLDAPSPHRVLSHCAVSKRCGGCQLSELSYEAELSFKQKKVRDALARIGGFPEALLASAERPILPSPKFLQYRNKAQYPVAVSKGHILSGFYAPHSHTVIPTGECALTPPLFADLLQCILRFLEEEGVSVYDEKTGKGLIRHILIRQAAASGEVQVLLVINGKGLPGSEDLAKRLTAFPGFTSLAVSVNKERSNVILGKSFRTLYGPDKITDTLTAGEQALQFQISPLSFYQVNSAQTGHLYEAALSFAELSGSETVWDLYCGIGTISLFLAKQASRVIGIEENPAAIRDARENAVFNHISNVEFYTGKAEEVLSDKTLPSPDVIVLDPPRAGLQGLVTEALAKASPKRIVYVSCNPATLARDLKLLCEAGFELKRFLPVDMFPRTTHVETVCLLSNTQSKKKESYITLDVEMADYYRIKNEGKNSTTFPV